MSADAAPVRFALAGLGVRGRQWAQAIAASSCAELAVAADPDPAATERTSASVYPTLHDALAGVPVDAVILATPPESHLDAVAHAAALGLPILCEKPLAESFEEAASMVAVAEHAGVPLLVGMNFRYMASTLRIRAMLDEHRYGEPMFSTFTYIRNRDGGRDDLNSYPLTMDNPMLIEQSIHHLDLLRFAFGREVESVIAESWNPPTSVYRGDAAIALLLRMSGGLRVTYLGTWTSGSNRFDFRWRTDCEDGVIVQAQQHGGVSVARRVPGGERSGGLFDLEVEPLIPEALPPERFLVQDTERLLEHFADVVRGRAEPGPSGRDHLRTMGLLNASIVAAHTGTRVDLDAHLRTLGVVGAPR